MHSNDQKLRLFEFYIVTNIYIYNKLCSFEIEFETLMIF